MNAQEKAYELYERYYKPYSRMCDFIEARYKSKECALIVVNELVKQEQINLGYQNAHGYSSEYWEEVKKEINNI